MHVLGECLSSISRLRVLDGSRPWKLPQRHVDLCNQHSAYMHFNNFLQLLQKCSFMVMTGSELSIVSSLIVNKRIKWDLYFLNSPSDIATPGLGPLFDPRGRLDGYQRRCITHPMGLVCIPSHRTPGTSVPKPTNISSR